MADPFQCGDIWSNNVEYNLADEVEACFVYGTAPANPWASAIHGLDSSDRVVEVRGEETNFYRDLAGMSRDMIPPSTLMDIVASSSNQVRAVELEMVPYVHPSAFGASGLARTNYMLEDCDRPKIDAIAMYGINVSVDVSRCNIYQCNSLSHRLLAVDATSSNCIGHLLPVASKLGQCNSLLHRYHVDAIHLLQRLTCGAINSIASIFGSMQY
ncbi:uncharacterized protein LOC110432208 [Sorghum bicolor]|nr:uncharacterized protein LOC110432208 [Sorghum bicolor]|eukprot:XP_021307862.1 uncharacterized protein LOC110432208 [Sorghum bicolor]